MSIKTYKINIKRLKVDFRDFPCYPLRQNAVELVVSFHNIFWSRFCDTEWSLMFVGLGRHLRVSGDLCGPISVNNDRNNNKHRFGCIASGGRFLFDSCALSRILMQNRDLALKRFNTGPLLFHEDPLKLAKLIMCHNQICPGGSFELMPVKTTLHLQTCYPCSHPLA